MYLSVLSWHVSFRFQETLHWSDMDVGLQSITETSLTGTKDIRDYQITNTINIESMQIKTYKIAFR